MDNLLIFIVLAAFVFLITYDPKSRTLETFVNNYQQCEPAHYQNVQFATNEFTCPPGPVQYLGAVIQR